MPTDKELADLIRRRHLADLAIERAADEWEQEENAHVDRRVRNEKKMAELKHASAHIDVELDDLFEKEDCADCQGPAYGECCSAYDDGRPCSGARGPQLLREGATD